MNNCLVTKLTASVNNPNLPLFETMQQFTLDAITESGNTSMTDAQKWALNHFFYRIGAIDNNGIFSKLKFLYLPMICGQNVTKSMVDYKGNYTLEITTPSDPSALHVEFSGNGIKWSDNAQHILNTYNSISDFSFTNYTIGAILFRLDNNNSNLNIAQDTTNGNTLMNLNLSIGGTKDKISFGTDYAISEIFRIDGYGSVATRSNTTFRAKYIAPEETLDYPSFTIDDTKVLPSAFPIKTTLKKNALWASFLANEFTEAEELVMADALRELVVKFPNPD